MSLAEAGSSNLGGRPRRFGCSYITHDQYAAAKQPGKKRKKNIQYQMSDAQQSQNQQRTLQQRGHCYPQFYRLIFREAQLKEILLHTGRYHGESLEVISGRSD